MLNGLSRGDVQEGKSISTEDAAAHRQVGHRRSHCRKSPGNVDRTLANILVVIQSPKIKNC